MCHLLFTRRSFEFHFQVSPICQQEDYLFETLVLLTCRKLLLKAGANAARRCHRGRTPLDEAPPQSEVAALLLARWKELEVEAAQKQAQLLDEIHEKSSVPPESESKSARKKRVKKARQKQKRSAEAGKPGFDGAQGEGLTGGVERLSELESEQSGIASDGEEETLESTPTPKEVGTKSGTERDVGDPNRLHQREEDGVEEGVFGLQTDIEVLESSASAKESSSDIEQSGSAPELAVEIDSSSESEGGEWVTVKSHRARKQAGQAMTPQSQKKRAIRGEGRVHEATCQQAEPESPNKTSAPAKEDARESGNERRQSDEVARLVGKQTVCLESDGRFYEEQKELKEMANRLRQESAELDGKRADIEGREKRLVERENEAEGQSKTLHRSRENPWLVREETTSNGAEGGGQEPSTSLEGKGFEIEPNEAAVAHELLRQREQELLKATQEVERLQGLLTALKEAHREEIRQTHAAAMAAAAASWRAWVDHKASEPLLNPAARPIGGELLHGGSFLTRTSSSGRPPPALRSGQTASVAALPPLPLLRPKQDSAGLSNLSGELSNGRPKWLEDAAAAAAVAAAAVMREKAFAQQWGRARAHTLPASASVLVDEALPTETAYAKLSSSSEFDTQSESGSSSARSEASLPGGFKRPSPPLAPTKSPPLLPDHHSGIRRGLPPVTFQGVQNPPGSFPLPTPRSHMESQWVFDSARGSMIPACSGPSMSSVEELFDQAPRLGLRATLARSRAYSSSNDLAGLSRAGGGGMLGVTSLAEEADIDQPTPYTMPFDLPSNLLPKRLGEEGFETGTASDWKPTLNRFGSGLRTLSSMTRSASESFLSALIGGGSEATHRLLPFAPQTPAGKAEGWFSLVPSPSNTAVKAAMGFQRTALL